MIIPGNLKKGDIVTIVAPSGHVDNEVLDLASNFLTEWGLIVRIGKYAMGKHHGFSGTVEERLNDLQTAFDDPEVKAVFCARGGYGSVQYIDKLSLERLSVHPKWLIGFSDITVIHTQLNRSGIASVHGPMPINFASLLAKKEDESLMSLKKLLFEGISDIDWKGSLNGDDFTVTSEIVGGNLSVLAGLRGTMHEPYYDGKILFIEDLNEYTYHIERLLMGFKLGGVFNRVNAIITGSFTDLKESNPPFGKTVTEIVFELVKESGIPVLTDFPAGHQAPNLAFPLGQVVKIEKSGNRFRLTNRF